MDGRRIERRRLTPAGWVAGSGFVLALFSPTAVGYAFVIAQPVVVAFLAELEYYGLRRIAS